MEEDSLLSRIFLIGFYVRELTLSAAAIAFYQAFIALFYIAVIPMQIAFSGASVICLLPSSWDASTTIGRVCTTGGPGALSYNLMYTISYAVDGAFALTTLIHLWVALPRKLKSYMFCGLLYQEEGGSAYWAQIRERLLGTNDDICSYATARNIGLPLLHFLLSLPVDAALWLNPYSRQFVPFVRFVRLYILALYKFDQQLCELERSQSLSFLLARIIRITYIVGLLMHNIACFFVFATQQDGVSQHYLSSPWMRTSPDVLDWQSYLRSAYWALMTLTTVGHVDVIDEDPSRASGETWEIMIAIVIIFAATLLYIWITANFTSMMIKVYQNLEKYRLRVSHVESYLKKHRVRATLCRLVRQHLKQAYENAGRDDDTLLRELPRSLRRELMIDINMRTLRMAPIFVGVDRSLVSMVCSMLTRVSFLREELIHKQGDVVRELLILESGTIMFTVSPPEEDEDNEADDDPSMAGSDDDVGKVQAVVALDVVAENKVDVGAENKVDVGESFLSKQSEDGLGELDNGGENAPGMKTPSSDASKVGVDAPKTPASAISLSSLGNLGSFFAGVASNRSNRSKGGASNRSKDNHLLEARDIEMAEPGESGHNQSMASTKTDPSSSIGTPNGHVNPLTGEIIQAADGATVMSLAALSGVQAVENPELISDRDEDEEEDEEEAEARREAATRKEILRLTGTCICEMAFLFGLRQEGDLHALSKTTCLALQSDAFQSVISEFPDAISRLKDRVLQRKKSEAESTEDGAMLKAIEQLRGFNERKIVGITELFRAAAVGDVQAVHRALSQAHDGVSINVDDVDYGGRTALHVAASKGWVEVVTALIDNYTCQVNVKDHSGNTPLSEAVKQMHASVAHKIKKAGGKLKWDEVTAAGELCQAAKTGNQERLTVLLESGAKVNAGDYDQRTALHLAASVGNLSIVEQLVEAGAVTNVVDRWKNTPMRDAIRGGHKEVARWLRARGSKLGMTSTQMADALCDFAKNGDVESIKLLTSCGCDVHAVDYDSRTCLHLAASVGNLQICNHVIDCGADVNCKDRWGGTPLTDAIREGHLELAKKLISRGARLDLPEPDASAELCEHSRKADITKVRILLESGLNVNAADYDKRTCLHLAASEGVRHIVTELIERGANVNGRDRWSGTPLSDAIREGHTDIARVLISSGGSLGYDTIRASSELCEYARQGDIDKIQMLLDGGCDGDAADYDERTCLHLAASEGNMHVVKLLVEHGADVNKTDRWGGSPLSDAVRGAHHEVCRALIKVGANLGYDETRAAGELCEYAQKGDLEGVKLLLFAKCSPDAGDYDRRTCLHLAASEGNLHIVSELCSRSGEVDINAKDRWGGTPLVDAIREGHGKVAKLLHQHGGDLMYDEATASGELCELARKGDLERIKLLLECGCSANSADYDKRTCLHLAASEGNTLVVETLAQMGANLNVQDRWQGTPLFDAVREGHSQVAKILFSLGGELLFDEETASAQLCEHARKGDLERIKALLSSGCSPIAADYDKRTALHVAASEGNNTIVHELLKVVKNASPKDRWGGTPLSDAVREGHSGVVKILVATKRAELGFDEMKAAGMMCELALQGDAERIAMLLQAGVHVNAADYDNRTCLHIAASEGNKQICEMLLSYDADINFHDRWSGSPLADAVREGNYKVANHLRSRGGELGWDTVRASGELCEHARKGDVQRVRTLLDCGVDPGSTDYDNRTALHLAACEGNVTVVKELLRKLTGESKSWKDRWGQTPLADAVRHGQNGAAKLLIDSRAQLGFDRARAASELTDLCKKGDVDRILLYIDGGIEVSAADFDGRTAAHVACSEGNMQIVERLIHANADLSLLDRYGMTPLADAVHGGHTKVAHLIYRKGGTLKFDEEKAAAEMCRHSRRGDLERVRTLLETGCPINAADYDGRTALHLSASEGNVKIVTELLQHRELEMGPKDRWGGTPLSDAVREGHSVVAATLIERGATLGFDEMQTSGELCVRAARGDVDRIRLLLKGKCDPSAADYDKRTCLHLAASEGNMHVIRELLSHGVSVNNVDRWGGSPLADAVRHGHRQAAVELRKHGAELMYDEMKASGDLCEFARLGDLENIKLLYDCGIAMHSADYDGRTVVHLAASVGHKHIVDYLAMKRCVNLALKDRWGGTALDDAVREKHTQLAETLFHFYRANGHVEEIEQHMDLLKVVSEVKDEEDGKGSSSKGWFNLSA